MDYLRNAKGKRVFVGLSGGVDSAVTVALLKNAGAIVTGVFVKGWYPPELPCTWAADRRDAMRVAARLRIPFLTLDASAEYKKSVIDYLIREYGAGRTPNPDIFCNRDVKFGAFYRFARAKGADFIATGHYARMENGEIKRGIDPAKDQSYFLWAIEKETLPHLLFPLGWMKKEAVRSLAKKYELPVAEKKDSQGICFLGSVSIADFLRAEVGLREGPVKNEAGEVIGAHDGAIAYTLGERVNVRNGPPGPWYVAGKDLAGNALTVSHALHAPSSDGNEIRFTEPNTLRAPSSKGVSIQYRYHGPIVKGALSVEDGIFRPEKPIEEPLAPGQSLVFYDGDTLIGGGIIR